MTESNDNPAKWLDCIKGKDKNATHVINHVRAGW